MEKLSALLSGGYEKYVEGQLSSSRNDFNQAINWAVVGIVTGLGVLATKASTPDIWTWSAALVLVLVLSHFATRAARGYVNILRWSIILRRITKYVVAQSRGIHQKELKSLRYDAEMGIATYHIDWACPISRSDLFKNVLRFGFGYLFAILFAYLIFTFTLVDRSGSEYWLGIAIPVVLGFSAWEWGSFYFRSNYMSWIEEAKEICVLIDGIKDKRFTDWIKENSPDAESLPITIDN